MSLSFRARTLKGLHYGGGCGAICAVVILGGDCAGNASLSLSSSKRSSASGSVYRVSSNSRPSVVGTCTSVICIAANFSMTLRGGEPRRQSGVQAIDQEGDEDMRFDPGLVLMEDRPDGEVPLRFLKASSTRTSGRYKFHSLAGSSSVRLVPRDSAPRAGAPVAADCGRGGR